MADGDDSFAVEIASTGQILTVAAGQSVTEALAAAGIVIPVACEAGACGRCVTGVLAGEIDHRDVYLRASEIAAGNLFTPCCSRALSPLLVLDL